MEVWFLVCNFSRFESQLTSNPSPFSFFSFLLLLSPFSFSSLESSGFCPVLNSLFPPNSRTNYGESPEISFAWMLTQFLIFSLTLSLLVWPASWMVMSPFDTLSHGVSLWNLYRRIHAVLGLRNCNCEHLKWNFQGKLAPFEPSIPVAHIWWPECAIIQRKWHYLSLQIEGSFQVDWLAKELKSKCSICSQRSVLDCGWLADWLTDWLDGCPFVPVGLRRCPSLAGRRIFSTGRLGRACGRSLPDRLRQPRAIRKSHSRCARRIFWWSTIRAGGRLRGRRRISPGQRRRPWSSSEVWSFFISPLFSAFSPLHALPPYPELTLPSFSFFICELVSMMPLSAVVFFAFFFFFFFFFAFFALKDLRGTSSLGRSSLPILQRSRVIVPATQREVTSGSLAQDRCRVSLLFDWIVSQTFTDYPCSLFLGFCFPLGSPIREGNVRTKLSFFTSFNNLREVTRF